MPGQSAGNFCWREKYSDRAWPFKPGMRMTASKRHTASNPSVNKIRDFSSGILETLTEGAGDGAKHSKIFSKPDYAFGRSRRFFAGHDFTTFAAPGFNFGFGRGADGADRQFLGEIAVAENLDAELRTIGPGNGTQRHFVHAGAVLELIEFADVDRAVSPVVATVLLKPRFGVTADERHLAAARNRYGYCGTRGLALPPRPAVLPQPLDSPWPRRLRRCLERDGV